jgi:hypothetical protein
MENIIIVIGVLIGLYVLYNVVLILTGFISFNLNSLQKTVKRVLIYTIKKRKPYALNQLKDFELDFITECICKRLRDEERFYNRSIFSILTTRVEEVVENFIK